jgi:hypothetical protein
MNVSEYNKNIVTGYLTISLQGYNEHMEWSPETTQ